MTDFDNKRKHDQRGHVQLADLEEVDELGIYRGEFHSDEEEGDNNVENQINRTDESRSRNDQEHDYEERSRSKRTKDQVGGKTERSRIRRTENQADEKENRSRTRRTDDSADRREDRIRSREDQADPRENRSRNRRTENQADQREEKSRTRRTEDQADRKQDRSRTRRTEDNSDERDGRTRSKRATDVVDKIEGRTRNRRTEDCAYEREERSPVRRMEAQIDIRGERGHMRRTEDQTDKKGSRSRHRKTEYQAEIREDSLQNKRIKDQSNEEDARLTKDESRDDDSNSSTSSKSDDNIHKNKIKSSVLKVEDNSRSERRERERDRKVRDDISGNIEDSSAIRGQSGVHNEDEDYMKAKRARLDDTLTTKTGGAYIPPARLRMMQSQITDKSSVAYQRLSWEALKKSLNGLINKANTSNLVHVVRELFQENIIRGRGLLARSIMQAQAASPTFTHVYAALVSIVNTKHVIGCYLNKALAEAASRAVENTLTEFPQIGELILRRLIIQFRKGYRRNDKTLCLSAARFIAHLVNQRVAHEVLSLEILHVLLESPTNDSVELAIGFLKECGQLLTKVSPKGVNAVFERLRTILHEAHIDKRVQYMVEVMFAVRKDGFKDHPVVTEELDIVEEDDQITHLLALENAENPEDGLNVFKVDENFLDNNEKYSELKREILGESSDDEDDGDAGSKSGSGDSDDSDSNESGAEEEKQTMIVDSTETNLLALRRTIYLTIQSSLDFEECAHKLLKMQMKPGQEVELCNMILDCCSQQRTFEKFYGLLAQRFCMLERKYVQPFQRMFADQYEFVHRLETNKLRNIAKLFAHLLHTDAISWEVLQCIHLNEDETTSSSRIFIKILFQELCEFMGLTKLNTRLKDQTLQVFFEGLFPRDNPRNTRFSINFFTSIGLGGLTDELRTHLKSVPKPVPQQTAAAAEDSSSSSSDSESSNSSDDSDSSSSSSSSSSEEEAKPAPTRLSEFLGKQPVKPDKHKASTQNRLLALANYGDDGDNRLTGAVADGGNKERKKHRHEENEKDREKIRDDTKKVERRRDERDKQTSSKGKNDTSHVTSDRDERRKSKGDRHTNRKRSRSHDRRR